MIVAAGLIGGCATTGPPRSATTVIATSGASAAVRVSHPTPVHPTVSARRPGAPRRGPTDVPGLSGSWRALVTRVGIGGLQPTDGGLAAYSTRVDVRPGGVLDVAVRAPAGTYRAGAYALGSGLRVWVSSWQHAPVVPACQTTGATGTTWCSWPASLHVPVAGGWPSGPYVLVLVDAAGRRGILPFVVGCTVPTGLLVTVPVTTYQAYNNWPAGQGKSLYGFNSAGARTAGGSRAATAVSFDRPYSIGATRRLLVSEAPLARWLTSTGHQACWTSDLAVSAAGVVAAGVRAVLVAGHDEYWDARKRDALVAARDRGVSLLVLGADVAGWTTSLVPSRSGVGDRVLVCTRRPPSWPAQRLLGAQYAGIVATSAPWRVTAAAGTWLLVGTGLHPGSALVGLVTGEVDAHRFAARLQPAGSPVLIVSSSRFARRLGLTGVAQTTLYQAPSGAWVFDAGTLGWTPALGWSSPTGAAVRQMTTTLIAVATR